MTASAQRVEPLDQPGPGERLDPHLALVVERVRARAARRVAWLRTLWNGELLEGDAATVGHAEIDAHLHDRDDPAAEETFSAVEAGLEELNKEIAQLDAAVSGDENSRFARLVRLFGLAPPESDLLQACVAVALDPNLGRVFAYLQDHGGRPYATEALVARLFGYGRCFAWSTESPLRIWSIVRSEPTYPGEPAALRVDPTILRWILGRHDLDPSLAGVARLVAPEEPLEAWPVEQLAERLKRLIDGDGPAAVRVAVAGPVRAGRRSFAASVAARLGLQLLSVDAHGLAGEEFGERLRLAQRQAFLDATALAWLGDTARELRWTSAVPRFPVQFVVLEPEEQLAPDDDWIDLRIDLPGPTVAEQATLWRRHVAGGARRWPKSELEKLLSRQQLSVGDIATIGRHGPRSFDEAAEAIGSLTRQRMTEFVQVVECPFEPEDLIVPGHVRQQLEEIVFEATDRRRLWETGAIRRLFPLGRGLIALFAGPSGSGKTMSAQVIARELKRPLFKVNTAAVVSRYVGDSSKRIRKVLSRAAHADALVLFDECEAFFGKRPEHTDAHDRYAATDSDDLLMAIEEFPGVALLSTSKKSDIDRAFLRRLRFLIDYPRPGIPERALLWSQLLEQMADAVVVEENRQFLDDLSKTVEITGAEVKQAVLNAVFAARRDGKPIVARHLLHGLERELQKQGRSFGERERKRLASHV